MLIIVIFIAIAIIIALRANNFEWDINVDFGGWLLSFMIIATGCAVITTFIICGKYPKQEKVTSSNTICNLFDTTKTETNQFLFRTEIDDVKCYKFYKNTSKEDK